MWGDALDREVGAVRVTEAMLSKQLLDDISNADQRRMKVHMSVSSGRRLNLPSDDPIGVVNALRYRQGISETRQYLDNVRDARDWLNATDSALSKAIELMQRARELAVTGASSNMPAGSFVALSQEVSQIQEELIQVGNISHGGRYIFSGFKTTTPAFDNMGTYVGGPNTDQILREVGPGVTISINLVGSDVLSQVLTDLNTLVTDLQGANATAVGNDIGLLDTRIDSLLQFQTQVGAKVNRLTLAENRLEDMNISLKQLQSSVEDADVAQLAVQLAREENAYQVSLAAAARVVQATLLDFLT